jgi:hypothetical protein
MQGSTKATTSLQGTSKARALSEHDGAPSTVRPKVLGWLSVALGATALTMPTITARAMGVPLTKTAKMTLQGVGLREIGVGVGLLRGTERSAAMTWLRVLGDAMDLSLLFGAMTSRRARRQRLLGAVGTIATIGVVDLAAAIMQTREERAQLA